MASQKEVHAEHHLKILRHEEGIRIYHKQNHYSAGPQNRGASEAYKFINCCENDSSANSHI
jgi:hypothetical protein